MARISWRGTLDLLAPRESAWHGARCARRPRESIDSRPLERVRLWKQPLKVAIPKRASADRAPNRGKPQVSAAFSTTRSRASGSVQSPLGWSASGDGNLASRLGKWLMMIASTSSNVAIGGGQRRRGDLIPDHAEQALLHEDDVLHIFGDGPNRRRWLKPPLRLGQSS